MASLFLKKRGVFFFEKPVTSDEVVVADLLNNYFAALNNGDIESLAGLFSEDASIYSYVCGGRVVTKKQHIECMKLKIHSIKPICFEETIVRIVNKNEAIITSIYTGLSRGHIFGPKKICLALIKEDGSWKIVKQSYIS